MPGTNGLFWLMIFHNSEKILPKYFNFGQKFDYFGNFLKMFTTKKSKIFRKCGPGTK